MKKKEKEIKKNMDVYTYTVTVISVISYLIKINMEHTGILNKIHHMK